MGRTEFYDSGSMSQPPCWLQLSSASPSSSGQQLSSSARTGKPPAKSAGCTWSYVACKKDIVSLIGGHT
jgi:hypothetical protein